MASQYFYDDIVDYSYSEKFWEDLEHREKYLYGLACPANVREKDKVLYQIEDEDLEGLSPQQWIDRRW